MWLLWGLIGICVGSFLGVLAERLPRGEDVIWSRSHCDHCKKTLAWYELIPLFSFALQRGRCRACRKKLSWKYPAIEVATGGVWGATALLSPPTILGVGANLLVVSSFLVIFLADLRYQIIPDSMLVAAALGVVGRWVDGGGDIAHALWAGTVAAGFFLFLWLVTRGRGIGLGDVKLAFLLGLLSGFPSILFAIYIAFLTGATVGVILILGGVKKLKSRIAFGPFLIIGALVALLWSDQLLRWWRTLV